MRTTFKLHFVFFFKTTNENAANRIFKKIEKLLLVDVLNAEVQLYWKDNALYECSFDIYLEGKSIQEIIFNALGFANTFAYEWAVRAPSQVENQIDFGGHTDRKFKISGIEWGSFEVLTNNLEKVE